MLVEEPQRGQNVPDCESNEIISACNYRQGKESVGSRPFCCRRGKLGGSLHQLTMNMTIARTGSKFQIEYKKVWDGTL